MGKFVADTGLQRTARLLNLVPFLSTHQGIEISTLSETFGVTEQQLIADLNTLWMCGLPGYTPLELIDLSFDSGSVTIWNAETLQNPRALNREESLCLLLGLGYLKQQLGIEEASLQASIEDLIQKIQSTFKSAFVSQVFADSSVSAGLRATLQKSISTRSAVAITYHSTSRDEINSRVVRPLEMRVEGSHEYLFAFCQTAQSHRTFRLDRIESIAHQIEEVESVSQVQARETPLSYQIEIKNRARDVVERFNLDPSISQLKREIQSFTASWLVREIMSFGGDVKLLAPIQARNQLVERSKCALEGYLR